MKALARYFAFTILSFLIGILFFGALYLAHSLVMVHVAVVPVSFLIGDALLSSLHHSLLPAVFFMIALMLTYSGRHRLPAFSSRFILFLTAALVLWGGLFGQKKYLNYSEAEKLTSPAQNISSYGSLNKFPGEILNYGPSSLVLLENGIVEAFPHAELALVPVSSQKTTIQLAQEPVSALSAPFRIDEPFSTLISDFVLLTHEIEQRMDSDLALGIFTVLSLCFLLVSILGTVNVTAWPLHNTLIALLFLWLSLKLVGFLSLPKILASLSAFLPKIPALLLLPMILLVVGIIILVLDIILSMARELADE